MQLNLTFFKKKYFCLPIPMKMISGWFSFLGFVGKTQRRCQECGKSQSDVRLPHLFYSETTASSFVSDLWMRQRQNEFDCSKIKNKWKPQPVCPFNKSPFPPLFIADVDCIFVGADVYILMGRWTCLMKTPLDFFFCQELCAFFVVFISEVSSGQLI